MSPSTTVIRVKALIDGTDAPPMEKAVVVVEGAKIVDVGQQEKIEVPHGPEVRELDFPDGYLLPGLVDTHTHLNFGEKSGYGEKTLGKLTYEDVADRDSDAIMLLRGAHNTHQHLSAGVTTLRDCGGRNRVTFDLREGARQGLVTAPRLLLSGRPATVTGGHFWWCNGEADGVDGVRAAVRRLIAEGADFIKIMASGGGTAITDNTKPSYSVEELRAIVEAAHDLGKPTTAHCIAAQSMWNAVEAGSDMMEHGRFKEPDGTYVFNEKIAERMAKQGMYLSPTIQVGYRRREALLAKKREGPRQQRKLDDIAAQFESQVRFLNKLWSEWNIKIVSGTDALESFGDYCLGLEIQSQAGMGNMDIIKSATSVAAEAVGVGDVVGTVQPGKDADLIVVDKDPVESITALRAMTMVMRAGKLIQPYGPTES